MFNAQFSIFKVGWLLIWDSSIEHFFLPYLPLRSFVVFASLRLFSVLLCVPLSLWFKKLCAPLRLRVFAAKEFFSSFILPFPVLLFPAFVGVRRGLCGLATNNCKTYIGSSLFVVGAANAQALEKHKQ